MLRFVTLTAVVLLIGPILGFALAEPLCAWVECHPMVEASAIVVVYGVVCFFAFKRLAGRRA